MKTYSQFLSEDRKVDPVELANRVSRRHGTKSSFGKWQKVEKGGHIPLSGYDGRKVNAADTKFANVQSKMGMYSSDPDKKKKGIETFRSHHETKTFNISDLKPTQKYVRTDDKEKLRSKVDEKDPTHIHIVTHKGVHYVADGHHAVMSAKLRGEKTVQGKHFDLDKF